VAVVGCEWTASEFFRVVLRDGDAPAARRPDSGACRDAAAREKRVSPVSAWPTTAAAAVPDKLALRSRDAPTVPVAFSFCASRRLAGRRGRSPAVRGGTAAKAAGTTEGEQASAEAAAVASPPWAALRFPAVRTTCVRCARDEAAGFASARREFTELTREAAAEPKVRPDTAASVARRGERGSSNTSCADCVRLHTCDSGSGGGGGDFFCTSGAVGCRAERRTHSAVAARVNGATRVTWPMWGTGGFCGCTRRRCSEPRSLLPSKLLQTESRRDACRLLCCSAAVVVVVVAASLALREVFFSVTLDVAGGCVALPWLER
jgi:hypothetical protein